MLDDRALKRLHRLSLLAEQAGGRSLLDAPGARPRHDVTEPVGVRDYAPGDDFRHVDWTLCGRRDELLTNVYEGEPDRHAYVLVDCSPSMAQGNPPKIELARQVAAALAFLATTRWERFSVLTFSDGLTAAGPAVRHPARLAAVLRFLADMRPHGEQTDLRRAAGSFVRRYQRHGPVVVLSDLYLRDGVETALDLLRYHGYDPRLVEIYDPRDARPDLLGDVELRDVESGAVRRVTVTQRAVERYIALHEKFQQSVRDYCSRRAIRHLRFACNTPEDEVLLTVLGGRRAGA